MADDNQPRNGTDDEQRKVLDPKQLDREGTDVGGPQSAVGGGVEEALTGSDPGSSDEGRSGTTPSPSGI